MPSLVGLVIVFLLLLCDAGEVVGSEQVDSYNQGGPQEYCLAEENFSPKCLMRNEVIVMISALYGRMKAGRCLEGEDLPEMGAFVSDPRILGCFSDVLQLLDRKCSGRQMCEIRGTNDADLKRERPCNKALKTYLEADYECVTVIEEDRSCLVSLPVSSKPLHIMHSSSSSCGTKSQPWRLEAPTGQQITVSVLDFSPKTTEDLPTNKDKSTCQQYGYIVDKSAKKNISICRLMTERKKLVYKSTTNSIDVVLNSVYSSDAHEEKFTFLLQIIAVGCSDIVPPDDSWLRRNDNEAVVGCYISRQTWHLRCVGSHWIGVIGNCTLDEKQIERSAPTIAIPVIGNPHQVLVIIAIGFLALVLCLIIICCAGVMLRRHYMTVARTQWEKVQKIDNFVNFNGTAIKPTINGHQREI